MKGMTFAEKLRIVLALVGMVLILYVPVHAIINRIVGADITLGWGLKADGDSTELSATAAADSLIGTWDIDQTISGEKTFSGDSLIVSTGGFRALNIDCYGNLTVNTGGTVTLPDNQIGNSEVAAIDSDWVTVGSIGSQSIKNPGVYGEDIGTYTIDSSKITNTIVKWGAKINAAQADRITNELLFEEGTDITITKTDTSFKFAFSGAGGNYDQFWGENDLAVSWGTDDSIDVFFPVCEKFGNLTHPYFVRNINASDAADDQKDTLVFSGRLPLGFNSDIDSFTLGYRTSTTTATTSGIKVIIYAMNDLIGFSEEDTVKYTGSQIASSSAGVWDWLSVAGASINAIGAGSWVHVLVEVEVDYTTQPETVDVERPYFWGSAK